LAGYLATESLPVFPITLNQLAAKDLDFNGGFLPLP
jgi:hypothetical protein